MLKGVLPLRDSLRGYGQLLRQLFLCQIPIPPELCDGLTHVFVHSVNPPSCGSWLQYTRGAAGMEGVKTGEKPTGGRGAEAVSYSISMS